MRTDVDIAKLIRELDLAIWVIDWEPSKLVLIRICTWSASGSYLFGIVSAGIISSTENDISFHDRVTPEAITNAMRFSFPTGSSMHRHIIQTTHMSCYWAWKRLPKAAVSFVGIVYGCTCT